MSDTPDGSPSKKKARVLLQENIVLGSDDELDLSAYKGLKKSEIKKLLKERERLRKRAAKEAEKAQAAERRRARGEWRVGWQVATGWCCAGDYADGVTFLLDALAC